MLQEAQSRMFLALEKWKTLNGFVQRGSEGQTRVTHKDSALETEKQGDV